MGIFRVRVAVYSLEDERRSQDIELVVDTGATYPVIPASVAESLGIRSSEEITFTFANGMRQARKMGWAGLAYDGRKTHSRIAFGEAEDVPLLGAFALEGLGYEVDPVTKTLRPATQYLLARRPSVAAGSLSARPWLPREGPRGRDRCPEGLYVRQSIHMSSRLDI